MSDVLVQKYDSSQKGARVGWSEVYVDDERPELIQVRGAIATVGENGASVSVCENRNLYHGSLVKGMSEACSWAMYLKADSPIGPERMDSHINENALYQMHGGGFHPTGNIEANTVKWGVGSEIMANIRDDLEGVDETKFYPTVYFAVNSLIGHGRQRSEHDYVSQEMLRAVVLADPSMADHTENEVRAAEEYQTQLRTRRNNNSVVIDRLQSDSVAPRVVADEFEESRGKARTLYDMQRATSGQMFWRGAVDLREGHVRTWPYMDVTEGDSKRSYGIELEGLRKNNGQSALRELLRENEELAAGIRFSEKGINTLQALKAAEQ